jgi:hypothetical protein
MSDEPEILRLKEVLSDLPDSLSWEQLWDLRTKVGELMLGATKPETRAILKAIYEKFTLRLKARAEELGKGEEFAEADRLTQQTIESQDVLGKLQDANSDLEFYDILNDPKRQNELAALQSVIETGGLPKNYLNQARNSHKSAYRIAKSARAGQRLRFRDILGFAIEWAKSKRKRREK